MGDSNGHRHGSRLASGAATAGLGPLSRASANDRPERVGVRAPDRLEERLAAPSARRFAVDGGYGQFSVLKRDPVEPGSQCRRALSTARHHRSVRICSDGADGHGAGH